ncbi:substrate-binding periplasmic protein [Treponema primitia]|uniref:substrate-binding periplasmic protein n=1 Tax=Treponema primitia TaxID=88058 RepID=UPI000255502E|nr:ABC transporter substrate-binding protein [Treponema primitia]
MRRIAKVAGLVLASMVLIQGVFAGGGKQQSGGLTIEEGTLTVGMEIGYPPMEYYDADGKTPIGFDVSLAKALAEKMGLKVKFVDTAWDGIFAGVDTGKYDAIMSSVTINEARLAAHNFSKPYVGNALAIVLLKNGKAKVKDPSELAGLGVAYQEETTSDFYMADLAAKGLQFTPYEYDKVMYCFDELKLGRVDAIVTDLLVAVDYVAPADSPFEIVWQAPPDETFGVCLKKGNDALTAEIDKALDALFADGTMLKISKEIFGGVDMVSAARK